MREAAKRRISRAHVASVLACAATLLTGSCLGSNNNSSAGGASGTSGTAGHGVGGSAGTVTGGSAGESDASAGSSGTNAGGSDAGTDNGGGTAGTAGIGGTGAAAGTGGVGGAGGISTGGNAGATDASAGSGGTNAGGGAGVNDAGNEQTGDASLDAADDSPCGDTQSDPYNCGSCGRKCPVLQPGQCVNGVCKPALVGCWGYGFGIFQYYSCCNLCTQLGFVGAGAACDYGSWGLVSSVTYTKTMTTSCTGTPADYAVTSCVPVPLGADTEGQYTSTRCCCQ